MDSKKVSDFISLAGIKPVKHIKDASPELKKLAAQLLLSETLEYVIKGLGVTPEFNGTPITEPDALNYTVHNDEADPLEMMDGLADVAYTMYWNSEMLNVPLEEAFDMVCDNNLEKFVKLEFWTKGECILDREEWHLEQEIKWPAEVSSVQIVKISGFHYAVGKDAKGKVRKPSSYKSVDLSVLL